MTISDTGWAKAMWGKIFGQWLCEAAVFAYDFDRFHADKILPLFKKYGVDAVYAGHTHQDYYSEYEGIKFITAGPVGSPLKLGYTGFNIVNIGPSGIIAEFVATPGEGLSQRITF